MGIESAFCCLRMIFFIFYFSRFSKRACSFALSGVSNFFMKQKDDIYPAYLMQYEKFGSRRGRIN